MGAHDIMRIAELPSINEYISKVKTALSLLRSQQYISLYHVLELWHIIAPRPYQLSSRVILALTLFWTSFYMCHAILMEIDGGLQTGLNYTAYYGGLQTGLPKLYVLPTLISDNEGRELNQSYLVVLDHISGLYPYFQEDYECTPIM